ncbi:MAG TPA: hypothetical protein VLG50_05265 [Candidatus Saccharimonadales bacterium]|nr:hypothetical protein [Candidatus Saccharimonadales bacterium]
MTKAIIISTLICVILILSTSVGLGILIRYGYLPEFTHHHESLCYNNGCYTVESTCSYQSGKITRYTPCNKYFIHVTLVVNDTNYDKNVQYRYCTTDNVTCFYDDRDIFNTLTLAPLGPPMSIVGIILISVFLATLLVGYVIVISIMCDHQFQNIINDD